MGVKPADGQVLVEEKRTRLEAVADDPKDTGPKPDIWEVVETLKPVVNLEKPDYEFTIYRGRKAQRADEKEWLGKFYEPMRREVIQQRFGGGEFNVWLKMGPGLQLRYNVDVKIGGDPIHASPKNAVVMPNDPTGQLIFMMREELKELRAELRTSRGGDLGLEAVKQALALNGQVFNSAANAATTTLTGLANGGHAPAANPFADPVAMINLMVQMKTLFSNPTPTNSLKETLDTIAALKNSGLFPGGGNEKLMDRLAMGLVGQLPTLAGHFSSIVSSMTAKAQAEAQTEALRRGQAIPVQPIHAHSAPPPQNVLQMPTPPAQPQQPTEAQKKAIEDMFETIEKQIVLFFNDPKLTAEQAAIASLSFIDQVDPPLSHPPDGKNLVDAILEHGMMGVNHLFTARPILVQGCAPGERLELFKREFIDKGRRVAAPDNLQPNPATPVA